MIQLSVRVELRDRSSDRSCGFTISERFLDYPAKGDHIIIPEGCLSVAGRFHFCLPDEDSVLMVATTPHIVANYDNMLKLLDWFKDQYDISDFKANSEPARYYSFYRSVIRLLGWKSDVKLIDNQIAIMKAFSAGASSVLVAELLIGIDFLSDDDYSKAYSESSSSIEKLLNIVLNRKQSGDLVDLLSVIKEWEPLANPDAALSWEATEKRCLDAAKFVFKQIKSTPANMLPDGLK